MKSEEKNVCKSNTLIEARYRLSLNEQKFVLKSISLLEKNDRDFKEYAITVKEFQEITCMDRDDVYKELQKIAENILKKPITIVSEKGRLICNWFSSVEYVKGEGKIIVCHDPKLKPYLLGMKERYTLYRLGMILKLRSVYSIRIYELLKQYQYAGERTADLEDLRKMLCIEEGTYTRFNDFRRFVLDRSQKEINRHTDIAFDYEIRKESRKITAIYFRISQRNGYGAAESLPAQLPEEKEIPEKIMAAIRPEYRKHEDVLHSIGKYMKEKGEKYVLDNICYANIKSDRSEGYSSFLALALKNNWGLGWAGRTEKTLEGEKLKTFARNLSLRCANLPPDKLRKTLESGIWPEITGSAEAAERMKDSIRLGQISAEQAKVWWENRERVEEVWG